MENKNVIIAFVLSTVIIFVWFYWLMPLQKPAPQPENKTEAIEKKISSPVSGVTPNPSSTAGPIQPTPVQSATAQAKTKEITIETPLYKAVLSNAGPAIRSFQLKKYRQTMDAQSPLVELIEFKNEQEQPLVIAFIPATATTPVRAVYELDAPENIIQLEPGQAPRTLNFRSTDANGLTVEQAFTFYPDKYPIDVHVNVRNAGPMPISGVLEATLSNRLPKAQSGYTPFTGTAYLANGKLEQVEVKKLTKAEQSFSGKIGWLAYENGYFINALIPAEQTEAHYRGKLLDTDILQASYTGSKITIANNADAGQDFILYLGPRALDILKSLDKKLELAVDFGWFDIIAKPCWYFLRFIHKYIPNYGLAIIILTVLIKILFWPLTFKSYKSMKEMQKLQPHLTKLREKFKDNREQMNKEMMNLYRTYKINPLGGCLPMVIQLPVFVALYNLLQNSIELRHAPFMLWIQDLAAPERLFTFPFSIPYMAPPYGVPILTLLMGATMFIQQKMTPTPGDPMQAKIMLFMPIMFTFFFINFPSGLVLYWLINNILSIGQQYQIMKKTA
ncbi:MAG: membrane protein insertase YidC [Desulfobacteraceae bacterium]|nr:MAG: membrane protein insertase YidC [Desulfobacteraceae bacterium]